LALKMRAFLSSSRRRLLSITLASCCSLLTSPDVDMTPPIVACEKAQTRLSRDACASHRASSVFSLKQGGAPLPSLAKPPRRPLLAVGQNIPKRDPFHQPEAQTRKGMMGGSRHSVDVCDFRATETLQLWDSAVSALGSGQEPTPNGGWRRRCRTMLRTWRETWQIQRDQRRRNELLTMTCRVSWPIPRFLAFVCPSLPPSLPVAGSCFKRLIFLVNFGKERRRRRRKFTSRVSFVILKNCANELQDVVAQWG